MYLSARWQGSARTQDLRTLRARRVDVNAARVCQVRRVSYISVSQSVELAAFTSTRRPGGPFACMHAYMEEGGAPAAAAAISNRALSATCRLMARVVVCKAALARKLADALSLNLNPNLKHTTRERTSVQTRTRARSARSTRRVIGKESEHKQSVARDGHLLTDRQTH